VNWIKILEFNWIDLKKIKWIQIQLNENGMQFGIKYIENFLATMVSEKKKHFEETQIWKNTFLSWELTKQILVMNYPKDNLFNRMIYKL
jgi:hypothetical protein